MKKRNALEILAPAGGREQLEAAVRAGADAVYLGATGFNARRSAQNFTKQQLADAVSYCHARGVAVHVTLNTLVRDDEMSEVETVLRDIADSGADAVLVQDLGIAAMVRERCPSLAMHASTQLAVHNLAGVIQLQKLGFSRVVLARELSLKEIEAVCAASPIEVEVFVHGALCMSVSGCCTLSSMIGGRSGNRGRCAQPCRLNFTTDDGREYALSLKDMSHLEHVAALAAAGVCSLKIEGRMKRPEYVAAAVHACRLAREGRDYDRDMLRGVFSRSGFTDGYLTGKRTLAMFGTRTKDDVEAFAGVQGVGDITRTEFPGVPVSMHVELHRDMPCRLVVTDGDGNRVEVRGEAPESARNTPATLESVGASLKKTGGTPFVVTELTGELDDGLAVRGGLVNALRRSALERLLEQRGQIRPHPLGQPALHPTGDHRAPAKPALRLRAERGEQLAFVDCADIDRVILPLGEIVSDPSLAKTYRGQLVAELPAVFFPDTEAAVHRDLQTVAGMGVTEALCENLGAIAAAKEAGLAPLGGAGLNLINTEALAAFDALGVRDHTVSFELDLASIRRLGGQTPRGMVGYGYLPLMRLRACPMQGRDGCGSCSGRRELVDRTGARFGMLCHRRQYTTLLNSVPLVLADKRVTGVDFMTLYFTTESAKQAAMVVEAYRKGLPLEGPRTGGLYHRVVE